MKDQGLIDIFIWQPVVIILFLSYYYSVFTLGK